MGLITNHYLAVRYFSSVIILFYCLQGCANLSENSEKENKIDEKLNYSQSLKETNECADKPSSHKYEVRYSKEEDEYVSEVLKKIEYIINLNSQKILDKNYKKFKTAILEVTLNKNGTLNKISAVDMSCEKLITDTLYRAVYLSAPFESFPNESSKKKLGIFVKLIINSSNKSNNTN